MPAAKFSNNQRGDTIIEVLMAIVILGAVLVGAFSIANQAFRTTQIARERTQATQYLQQQNEAVYGVYNTLGWEQFKDAISSSDYQEFHVAKVSTASGPQWELNDDNEYTPTLNGKPTIYKITVERLSSAADMNNNGQVKLKTTITWLLIGGSRYESAEVYLNLSDKNLPRS